MSVRNEVWDVPADASISGRPILISAVTAATAQLLHTATNDADTFDEIWIWGFSLSGATVLATIGFGSNANAGDQVSATIPANTSGPWCLIPGWRLQGGLPVYGYAALSGAMGVKVQVNRTLKVTS